MIGAFVSYAFSAWLFFSLFLRLPLRHAVWSAVPEVLSLPPYSGESVPGPAARCRGSGHSALAELDNLVDHFFVKEIHPLECIDIEGTAGTRRGAPCSFVEQAL